MEDSSVAGPSRPCHRQRSGDLLSSGDGAVGGETGIYRKTSNKLGSALARVTSTEAHPPSQAHLDIPVPGSSPPRASPRSYATARSQVHGRAEPPELRLDEDDDGGGGGGGAGGGPTRGSKHVTMRLDEVSVDRIRRGERDIDSGGRGGREGAEEEEEEGEIDEERTVTGSGGEKRDMAPPPVLDIEHMPCEDDPREWGWWKKHMVLFMISAAFFGPLLAPSIYNPVIEEVRQDLRANDTQIGLSLSIYILFQGWFPILWATAAEIIGRKIVYLSSYSLYTVATVVASRSPNMPTLVAMRAVQAMGSAAVTSVGAGTLAEIFEPHERGKKLGFYYGVSLVGPSIGPFIGGILGNAFGWRSTQYFLAVFAALVDISFIFFPDTWRKERSRVYQTAMRNAVKRAMHQDEVKERKRQKKLAHGLPSNAATPGPTSPPSPNTGNTRRQSLAEGHGQDGTAPHHGAGTARNGAGSGPTAITVDMQNDTVAVKRRRWYGLKRAEKTTDTEEFRPTMRDVNPLPSMWSIAKMPTNVLMIACSGWLFAAQYCIPYTASLTLAKAPYSYSPLTIGLVVLSFGGGSLFGSIIGGRLSDRALAQSRKVNNGINIPEYRLRSALPSMPFLVASFLTYGWLAEKHVHIAGIVVMLFCAGLSLMLVYSSAFAYMVDANPGRSASAISCNSLVRGSIGCVFSQVAIYIQNGLGDGGLYTLMGALLAVACAGICWVLLKGASWRADDYVWRPFWAKKGSGGPPKGTEARNAGADLAEQGASEKSSARPTRS